MFSTTGDPYLIGLSGLRNEDVLQFTPTSLGTSTAGTYLLYLDLSTKGIATTANLNGLEIIE